jgi:ferredoxin--NADP+ reductase
MTTEMQVGSATRPLRVAIVGSGPAGFFAADALLKQKDVSVHVDMYERLPTPYGLVRGGVAPDHQKIKSIVSVYEQSAQRVNFRFMGNVELGRDITVETLRQHYDQIVYATGSEASRRLGVPGEGLWRCTPAAVFVGWYNGHPDYRPAPIDLNVRSVAIIGNGNVAIDVARILAKTPKELESTDIASHALAALSKSTVENIYIIGRRGPVQSAFTPSEMKELGELEAADPVVDPAVLVLDAASEATLAGAGKQTVRNMALMTEYSQRQPRPGARRVHFRYFRSPVEILGDDDGMVCGIRLVKNAIGDNGRVTSLDEHEELDVQMVVPAIGYLATPTPGVPFDKKRAVIANVNGRVAIEDGQVVVNEYVVGWARSGAQGLLGSHRGASAAVVDLMFEDLASGGVEPRELPALTATTALLRKRGVEVVSFDDWKVLDEIESRRGVRRGAPRDKVTDVAEMISLIQGPE